MRKLLGSHLLPVTRHTYIFYNNYALTKGFGTRRDWNSRSRSTGQKIRIVYVCNKEGKKTVKDRGDHKIPRRRETRTGCMTKMEIVLSKDGGWKVAKFNNVHNHPITPRKVMIHCSHKQFHQSTTCKPLITDFHQAGLRPSLISRALNAVIGNQGVDVTQKQCSNYLLVGRKKM
ncbi:FAR1 domain-containing protein [Cephalotus follicularis]|uniref:FAR1 domain-containing protein n=1 Tax=Cephalotus follicularis TaxID=3775 RepID=A0A1Q3B9C1_CEPFO|nr:FAR1 domain-containing protein [Cephalotus follicularis]